MFCKNCGSQIDDKAVICPHCGIPVDDSYFKWLQQQQQPQQVQQQLPQQPQPPQQQQSQQELQQLPQQSQQELQQYQPAPHRGIVTAAKVFIILGFFALGITLIAFIIILCNISGSIVYITFFIFETILGIVGIVCGAAALTSINCGEKPSTSYNIGILLCLSTIAGILLLCSKEQDYKL